MKLPFRSNSILLAPGSRAGGQPLTLQDIWNNAIRPPWSSNYTVNINTQMNYWGASRAGLSECIEPLQRMIWETMQNGRVTARVNYGCRGFACNHNVDLWRKTPPVRGTCNYMFAPLCGVWLANELYAHKKNGYQPAQPGQLRGGDCIARKRPAGYRKGPSSFENSRYPGSYYDLQGEKP